MLNQLLSYLITPHGGFGAWSWLGMLIWLFALGGGAYTYSSWQERNPVRSRFVRRLGLGLAILGAVGLVLLFLKATGLPYIGWPVWTYLWALATLVFIGWAIWFYSARLPQMLEASRQVSRTGRVERGTHGARTYTGNGARSAPAQPAAPPRPVATTGRREARRDKKRRTR